MKPSKLAAAAREAYGLWEDMENMGAVRGKAGANEAIRLKAERAVRRALPALVREAGAGHMRGVWENRLDTLVRAGEIRAKHVWRF